MNNKERKQKTEEFLKALTNPKGALIKRGDSLFMTCDNATFGFSHSTLEEAATYLYLIFHHTGIFKPEFSVFNPKPSRMVKTYIMPRDTYLWDEQKQMETMNLHEFISFLRELVEKRNVPLIGVIGGMYGKDNIRTTYQVFFSSEMRAKFDDGNYPAIGSVVGGTSKSKNAKAKEDFFAKLEQAVNDYNDGKIK